jgi:hypothetical protein
MIGTVFFHDNLSAENREYKHQFEGAFHFNQPLHGLNPLVLRGF